MKVARSGLYRASLNVLGSPRDSGAPQDDAPFDCGSIPRAIRFKQFLRNSPESSGRLPPKKCNPLLPKSFARSRMLCSSSLVNRPVPEHGGTEGNFSIFWGSWPWILTLGRRGQRIERIRVLSVDPKGCAAITEAD